MTVETLLSQLSTAMNIQFALDFFHGIGQTLVQTFATDKFPHRLLLSLQEYSYIIVASIIVFSLDCASTYLIWKNPSNRTQYGPNHNPEVGLNEDGLVLFGIWLPHPMGVVMGYYGDIIFAMIQIYVVISIFLCLLIPDTWRRLGTTLLLWLPLCIFTLRMLISYSELHSILLETSDVNYSRCNSGSAILSCDILTKFPNVVSILRMVCASIITTAALWYDIPTALAIVSMAVIHTNCNYSSHDDTKPTSMKESITDAWKNLLIAKVIILVSAIQQGFTLPIRVSSQEVNTHTNWTMLIVGCYALCGSFRLIFRFYMFDRQQNERETRLSDTTNVPTKEEKQRTPKIRSIYYFASMFGFLLSGIIIATLKAINVLDLSIASCGFFVDSLAALLIPFAVQIIALARVEEKEVWSYKVVWQELEDEHLREIEYEDSDSEDL